MLALRLITGIALCMTLIGCAGLHVVPPDDYSLHTPLQCSEVIRVVIDQNGDPYPASPPFQMPAQDRFSFGLEARTVQQAFGAAYDVERRIEELSDSISTGLSRTGGPLIVLVHGFNNSYRRAEASFERWREQVESGGMGPYTYLEVYWDGIYRGPLTFRRPFAYWFNATTYSNLAGQRALRSILNRIPNDVNVRFITHSRGAAVAMSALANPYYDDHIEIGSWEAVEFSENRDVVLGLIAPAVGWAHVDSLAAAAPNYDLSVVIGFNRDDPALGKPAVGASRWGTTELGVDAEYLHEALAQLRRAGIGAQHIDYSGLVSHSWLDYLSKEEETIAFLRTLGLSAP